LKTNRNIIKVVRVLGNMQSVYIRNKNIYYNHPHDIAAIIESYILDVYTSGNIKKGNTVIDVGAGIGEFSLLASELVGPEGKVVAIEPSPDDFVTLKKNLEANSCKNVIPVNKAVSDKKGVVELNFKGREFTCDSESLIGILGDYNINSKQIDFIKMDIEGGEKFVIPQSLELIKNVKFLAMEIHEGYQISLVPLLKEFGFQFERITKSKYIRNAVGFSIVHPIQANTLLKLLKKGGEYPGLMKISNGIEIANSNNLVVGTFSKPISNI